ncbi:MAG: right-handed parallel beta-helix repeat-containing protein [Acidimicrobiales bacterium]
MSRRKARPHSQTVGAAVALVASLLAVAAVAPSAGAAPGFEIIRTIAGNGEEFFNGDGQPATEAALGGPFDVAIDGEGNFYIAEVFGNRVRKVDTNGIITTIAGDGTTGQCSPEDPNCDPFTPPPDVGDGGPATEAQLNQPTGVAVDVAGNVYIAESQGNRVRRVDAATGIITTVAGTGAFGFSGDGGPATEAVFASPVRVALDNSGTFLYIVDQQNLRIRVVDLSTGIITTFAGNGEGGFGAPVSGDGGPATEAVLGGPLDVDVDSAGNVFIAAEGRVRRVDATTCIITTVAGTGELGFSGDGGPATEAAINPQGISVDGNDLYIADGENNRIRVVDLSTGIITTVAGTGERGFSGDGGPPTQAELAYPVGIDVDEALGILFADLFNARIRQILTVPDLLSVTKTDAPDPVTVGQELTYTITVDSNGTGAATGAKVIDTLPAEVTFVSASATQGSCGQAGGTVTCQLGDLAPDASAVVTVVVAPTTPTTITNTAIATADQADPFPGNDRATTQTQVGALGCGQLVTTSTQLSEDVGPCPADGVIIAKDNVTLDLGGHRIFGFEGPGDGTSAGIRLPNRNRVTIRNGTVSGFDAGVVINQGRSNIVQGMTVTDNVGPDDVFNAELGDGIAVFDSGFNRILDNTVTNNGVFDGIGVLGGASDGNRIQGNTVANNLGPSDGGPAGQGIIVNSFTGTFDGATITGTATFDNVVRGNASAGIANVNNTNAKILRNLVERNGLTNAAGNGIGIQLGPRATVPYTRVLVQDNQVHGNGGDGIQLGSGARENRILDNDAADNAALASPFNRSFDLHDNNRDPATFLPSCDANVWRGNIWGSGFYSPVCVTFQGSGPPIPPEPEGLAFGFTCYDDLDNDQDGFIDFADPACQSSAPTVEGEAPSGDKNQAPTSAQGDEQLPPARPAPVLELG